MKKLIVILAVIAMVGAFTATAIADVSLYGSARFRTYYADVDSGVPGADSDKDLEWRQGFLNRFGANFKADKITGKLEIDSRAGSGRVQPLILKPAIRLLGPGNLRLRHLWGQYDFGIGKLMIGQNYPLYDAPVSGINYYSGGLQKFGGIGYDVARTGQIRLTFGDFRVAFLPPDTARKLRYWCWPCDYDEVNTTVSQTRTAIRHEDGCICTQLYRWVSDHYEALITSQAQAKNTENIDSFVLGARAKANFGPAYAGLGLTYRQNGDNYGAWTVSSKEAAIFQGNNLKDGKAFGIVASLGWKVNDMFTLEGSFASLSSSQDTDLNNEDDAIAYGVIGKITVAPGVYHYSRAYLPG